MKLNVLNSAKKALSTEIVRIKTAIAADPTSKFAKANQHVLARDVLDSVWVAGGELDFGGVIWWTLRCDLVATNGNFAAVSFSAAGGPDWDLGIVDCWVAGAFVVDPSTIQGNCNFTCVVGAAGEGAVVLTLYAPDGTLYGTFAGAAEGAGAAYISGSGSLNVG